MKVVLLQDIPSIGKKMEVKEVSDGYARNFLLPRKLAERATEEVIRTLANKRERVEQKKSVEYGHLREMVEKLKLTPLLFKVKMGEKGRSFGSVTAVKIRDALKKERIIVEKDWITLEEPIKTAGEHQVTLNLPQDLIGQIKIIVEAE